MFEALQVLVAADADNFTESGYLAANPGVEAALRRGVFDSAREHFERFGQAQGRKVLDTRLLPDVLRLRRDKLEALGDRIEWDRPHDRDPRTGQIDFLSDTLRENFGISDTEHVSAHDYGLPSKQIIESLPDGLVLDCGAGLRNTYYSNVVNYEVAPYYSTDVLGVGEELPFSNDTFDAVLSIAVLEHTRHPLMCASEIARVLKPGGRLFSAVPFLHEYHGFPHHYFNMTIEGHRSLYEGSMEIQELHVPRPFWPIRALQRMMRTYSRGLPSPAKEEFASMTVGELMEREFEDHASRPYVTALATETQTVLAGGTFLHATKKA